MYLLATINNFRVTNLLNDLKSHGIDIVNLSLGALRLKMSGLQQLAKRLNKDCFDCLVIVSPSAINFLDHPLIRSTLPSIMKFMVMGEASANTLQAFLDKVAAQRNIAANIVAHQWSIMYPKRGQGVQALIDEVLMPNHNSLHNRSIGIIHGNSSHSSHYLENYMRHNHSLGEQIKIVAMSIYECIPCDIQTDLFYEIKSLIDAQSIQGVIITSDFLLDRLFSFALFIGRYDYFKSLKYIVLHANLKNKLFDYGVKEVLVAKSASYEELVKSIIADDTNNIQ